MENKNVRYNLCGVACRAKRKKLTRKMQKSRLKRLENDVPNGIFI